METYVYIFVSLLLLIWAIYLFVWRDIKQAYQLKNFRKQEFNENIKTEATEEPNIFRELTEAEKAFLTENTKSSKWSKILTILCLTILGLILWYVFTTFSEQLFGKPNVSALGFVVIIILVIAYGSINHDKTYLDLRSPVFKIKGKLYKKIKEQNTAGTITKKAFVIRGLEFDSGDNPQVDSLWNKWPSNEIVEVEYSPFSKHIWKIHKA